MKRNSSQVTRKKKGFTLVELVVVIAVLAILAGVGVVAYNGYITYAQKGKDRETVGEIMHALELADYADPSLINGATTVYFTKENGIVVPTDVKGTLTAALEDAFGEGALANTTPKYDGWGEQHSGNLSLSGLPLKTTADLNDAIKDYIAAVSNGGAASFAGDIDTLWDSIGNIVKLAETTGTVGGVNLGLEAGTLFEKAIKYSNQSDEAEHIRKAWTEGDVLEMNAYYAAAIVARNYAFASYAMRHPSATQEMKDRLNDYTDLSHFGNNIALQYISDSAYFTGAAWDTIKQDYISSGQAKIDAEAYLGIMKTAGSVDVTKQGDESMDDAYIRAFREYTDELGAMLSDPSLLSALQDGSGSSGITGVESENGVAIRVQKMNGALTFSVNPTDADPTGGSYKPTEKAPTCEKEHCTKVTIQNGRSSGIVFAKEGASDTNKVITIDLCTIKSGYNICTIVNNGVTINSVSVTSGTEYVEASTTQIKALRKGTATIEFKATSEKYPSEQTLTITVNIH